MGETTDELKGRKMSFQIAMEVFEKLTKIIMYPSSRRKGTLFQTGFRRL